MYSEAKKLQLIEKVIRIKSDVILMEIEALVNKTRRSKKSKPTNARDFLGLLSEKDASLIEAAIEEGCEQINPDDWK